MDEIKDYAAFWFFWICLGLFLQMAMEFFSDPPDEDDWF